MLGAKGDCESVGANKPADRTVGGMRIGLQQLLQQTGMCY